MALEHKFDQTVNSHVQLEQGNGSRKQLGHHTRTEANGKKAAAHGKQTRGSRCTSDSDSPAAEGGPLSDDNLSMTGLIDSEESGDEATSLAMDVSSSWQSHADISTTHAQRPTMNRSLEAAPDLAAAAAAPVQPDEDMPIRRGMEDQCLQAERLRTEDGQGEKQDKANAPDANAAEAPLPGAAAPEDAQSRETPVESRLPSLELSDLAFPAAALRCTLRDSSTVVRISSCPT